MRRSSSEASCPATAIRARTAPGSSATSCPATTARPDVGASSVVRMRTAVVLPAPLWPSRPSTVPEATSRSRSASACVSPKRRPSPSVRTAYEFIRRTIGVRCTSVKSPADLGSAGAEGPRPSEPAVAAGHRGRGDRDRGRRGPRGRLDAAAGAGAARGGDVALPLLREPRRAARADDRHGGGRDGRAGAAGAVASGGRGRRPSQPRHVPPPHLGAADLPGRARGHAEPAASHRAVRAVGRRRWPAPSRPCCPASSARSTTSRSVSRCASSAGSSAAAANGTRPSCAPCWRAASSRSWRGSSRPTRRCHRPTSRSA